MCDSSEIFFDVYPKNQGAERKPDQGWRINCLAVVLGPRSGFAETEVQSTYLKTFPYHQ